VSTNNVDLPRISVEKIVVLLIITMHFIAGKTMGTPILKDGIKCIGFCADSRGSASSDSSDDDNVK
jgi:hypothetical protein